MSDTKDVKTKIDPLVIERVKKAVLENAKEGRIIFATIEGLMVADLDEIIKQPAEGLLYDLNRDRATVLTFIDNPNPPSGAKWINDFAMSLVVEKLHAMVASLGAELAQYKHVVDLAKALAHECYQAGFEEDLGDTVKVDTYMAVLDAIEKLSVAPVLEPGSGDKSEGKDE